MDDIEISIPALKKYKVARAVITSLAGIRIVIIRIGIPACQNLV